MIDCWYADSIKNIWKELSGLVPPDLDENALAKELFREYEHNGFIDRTASELLQYNLPVIVNFFYRIGRMHSSESPILRRRDTRWMSEFDYTMVNIRAAELAIRVEIFYEPPFSLAPCKHVESSLHR